MLWEGTLCCVMLCYAMPCHVTLRYVTLCCVDVMLCYVVIHVIDTSVGTGVAVHVYMNNTQNFLNPKRGGDGLFLQFLQSRVCGQIREGFHLVQGKAPAQCKTRAGRKGGCLQSFQ